MKAYRQPDGSIALFRPDANSKRFANSAKRLALPEMPDALFLETVETLVKQDAGWVPNKVGESLYIRPFMIATLIHQRLFQSGFQLNTCVRCKVEQVKQSAAETTQHH
jgi:branched-subunit amino acid aminotransferase/4-amino-4-deoxychorismate lyase